MMSLHPPIVGQTGSVVCYFAQEMLCCVIAISVCWGWLLSANWPRRMARVEDGRVSERVSKWVAGNNSRMCNKWLVLAPSFTLYLSFCLTVCVIVAEKMWRRPLFLLSSAHSQISPSQLGNCCCRPPLLLPRFVFTFNFLRTKNCGCWCCCRCRPRCFVFAGNLLHSNWWARRECWGREREKEHLFLSVCFEQQRQQHFDSSSDDDIL